MAHRLVFTKQAQKDFEKYKSLPALFNKLVNLLDLLESKPLQNPPSYEKLLGDLEGAYSRRINKQHRLVYEICEDNVVKIIRIWSHYE